MRRLTAVLLMGGLVSLTFSTDAAPAEDPTTPQLSFVSGDTISFQAEQDSATGQVLVKNTGLPTDEATFTVVLDDGTVKPVTPEKLAFPPGEVVPAALSIPVNRHDERNGRLIVDAVGTSDDPAVTAITIDRSANGTLIALPVVAGLVASAVLLIVCFLTVTKPETNERYSVHEILPTADGKWSFSQSWASNLTALGAVLGTVLGASGYITEAFANYSVSQFVGLNLLFGGLALLAPVVYLGTRRIKVEGDSKVIYGTYGGLLAASFLTCWAVMSELVTILTLLVAATLSKFALIGFGLLFALAFFSILIYVYNSIGSLAAGALDSPPDKELQVAAHDAPRSTTAARRQPSIL